MPFALALKAFLVYGEGAPVHRLGRMRGSLLK